MRMWGMYSKNFAPGSIAATGLKSHKAVDGASSGPKDVT